VIELSTANERIGNKNRPIRASLWLVALMLVSSMSPLVASSNQPSWASVEASQETGLTDFVPAENNSSVRAVVEDALVVSANQTFTDGTLTIQPIWGSSSNNGTNYGIGSSNLWNGTHNQTNGIGHGGRLTLATDASLGTISDFESTVRTASGWMGVGADHEAWAIVQPSLQPLVSQSGMNLPTNGSGSGSQHWTSQSMSTLSTRGLGDLGANMTGCIRSPSYQPPSVINNYTLFFTHWLAMNNDDAAWVEVKTSNGQWTPITPNAGYPSTSTNPYTPTAVWNGVQTQWTNATFHLDPVLSSLQNSIEFQFCYATGTSSGFRGGWFVDELLLQNQGDAPGAWFHGNLSGDYLANAEGLLTFNLDVSNHTGQTVELEVSANWDIEGGSNDYLTVWISFDNGTTFSPISTPPGLPGRGAFCNGAFFNGPDSGNTWCPAFFSLPWNTTSPQNASNVLLRLWAQTNGQTNFGGTASSGWEGIAIDDISVWLNRGTATQSKTTLANFTSQPSQTNGSASGWLSYDGTAPNQWQWVQTMGNNGPTSTTEDFETGYDLPAGWSLDATSNRRWEVGPTSNSSGFGPGVWHSGTGGAGIYLDDEYRNNMLTNLYTPEYTLPVNSTARLTFRSWVCTEASWDGGAVSLSTDGGENWWFLPPTLNGFHDQISTVNSASPLFGEGIIDGSGVAGGCHNVARGFELKSYDVSNLSGMNVRAKFTFFSDQLIELDGWYIDDAGIEIDVYEPEGNWTSGTLLPHPLFGWGQVDGFVHQPENTSIGVDVLDSNGTIIQGYANRSLPLSLPLDTIQHPTISLRIHLASDQTLLTPSIERLTVGSVGYYDAYHHRIAPYSGVGMQDLTTDRDSRLVAGSTVSALWTFTSMCPFQTMVLQTYGGNLTASHAGYALDRWTYTEGEPPVLRRELTTTSTPAFTAPLAMTWSPGTASNGFTYEPLCSLEPQGPAVTLGEENRTLFSWPGSGDDSSFGLVRGFHDSENLAEPIANGTILVVNTGVQSINVSWRVPVNAPYIGTMMTYQAQFLVEMESTASEGQIEIQQGGPTLTISPSEGAAHHRVTHGAACLPVVEEDEPNQAVCHLQMNLNGSFMARLSEPVMVPSYQTIVSGVPFQTLNEVADNFRTNNTSATMAFPLRITTDFGSVSVNLNTTTQPMLVDRILPIAHQLWLPETTVVFQTQHWRGDANQPSYDAPDIAIVDLLLSPSKHQDNALVHLQVINLDTTPQFRQMDGAAYAQLKSSQSSIECSVNVCNATWALTSTWAFDDIDDLHVLTSATDENGFSTGPAHTYRQTVFNEIENDLEVIDFTVMDSRQRNLNDWSNPQWPFHLNASQEMVASGSVRYEGIAQSYVGQGEAEVRIDAHAMPPLNLSGGPNEWPGEAVEWTASWFVEVDSSGGFSIDISSPLLSENVPSGTRIHVTPHIERCGPLSDQSSTSQDKTSLAAHAPYLYDRVSPNALSLIALDSGGYAPAENHIWMKGQDVALRVALEDAEGLSNSLQLHTWLESRDDANFDGTMDAGEYMVQTVTFNNGLTEAVVDLPLLSWNDITGGASHGRASIVIEATDLAGNPLLGGGVFGESTDLATIFVQERYDTTVDTTSLQFDDESGALLLGHEHHFQFTLTDGNGIQSLDAIELALLGRDEATSCFVTYKPRTQTIVHDNTCFATPPEVHVEQIGLLQSWVVSFNFRLSWDLAARNEPTIPSLKIFDEGQDLGLGLSKMTLFSWVPSSLLTVQSTLFEDRTLPIGDTEDGHLWVHRNDTVQLTMDLVHANTTVLAEHLPATVHIDIVLSDGERTQVLNASFDASGTASTLLLIDEGIIKHNTGFLDLIIDHPLVLYEQRFNITIDRFAPQLTVPPGTLSIVDSDALDSQEIIIILSDQEGLSNEPVNMHWRFVRLGVELPGASGVTPLSKSAGNGMTNTYAGEVDLRPTSSDGLDQNDRLEVWFSGSDRAGRNITGFATIEAPMTPSFRWIAFEPRFDDIVVTPYTPVLGENITIFVRIANEGLLSGNITVECRDADGRVLETNSTELAPGTWVEYRWSVETWTTGRLGLSVTLVNVTGDIPLPMGEVKIPVDSSKGGIDTLGFAVLLVILAAGVLGFSLYRRQESLAEFTQKQVEKALLDRSLPPPRPADLDDLGEEQ
jgi:hypothetical protein